MEQLSLGRINSSAPYKVWEANKTNGYNFLTENGVLYGVGFTEEMLIGGRQAYQFSFARLNAENSSFDEKIKRTLLAIIHEFFDANNEVMIYICDTSDGKETFRNRLFIKWFEEDGASQRYVIKTASAIIEEQGFYTAMIVERTNKHLTDIIDDFESTAQVLCNK